MSTLQISLAVAGVILLCLIFAYNTWINRRNTPKRPDRTAIRQRLEPSDRASAASPAMPTARQQGVDITSMPPATAAMPAADSLALDPVLGSTPAGDAPGSPTPGQGPTNEPRPVPVTGELFPDISLTGATSHALPPDSAHDDGLTAAIAPVAERRRGGGLEPRIDAIVPLRLDSPVTGEAALLVQPATRRAGSKPFHIEGLNAATGLWEAIRPGQSYNQLQAGMQLANRLGALNDVEFAEFTAKVRQYAERIGATATLPEAAQEIARARELDQFASEHDAQLGFVIRPRDTAWSPGYIDQHAAAAGFTRAAMPGRMQLPSQVLGNAPLLLLSYDTQAVQATDQDQIAIHEILLSLDVPQVPREEKPFERLCESAQALCTSMDGVLCDQNGYPLPPQALDTIGSDLQALYDTLDARGLPAGSALARRLFS